MGWPPLEPELLCSLLWRRTDSHRKAVHRKSEARLDPALKGQVCGAQEDQAYLVGRDGYCIKTIDVICADDEAAKKRALKMVDGHDVELWHHERKIAKFKGDRSGDTP
jgi:hypothetical protein